MQRFVLFLFMLSAMPALAQPDTKLTGKVAGLQQMNMNAVQSLAAKGIPAAAGSCRIVMRCHSTINSQDKPLFVVDGMLMPDSFSLNHLKAEDIRSVEILKNAAATAIYGYRAMSGVVIITTNASFVRIRVVDSLSGEPVPRASVHYTTASRFPQARQLVADSAGYFEIEKYTLRNLNTITVTAIGHQETGIGLNAPDLKYGLILLARKTIPEREVAVVRSNKRVYCNYYLICRSISRVTQKTLAPLPAPETRALAVYPNPAKRGEPLHLRFAAAEKGSGQLVLFTAAGQPVFQQTVLTTGEAQQITLNLPANIARGVYTVLLKMQNGKTIKQERVVIM